MQSDILDTEYDREVKLLRRDDCYWCESSPLCFDNFCLSCHRYSSKTEGYAPEKERPCRWSYLPGDADDSLVLVTCSDSHCNNMFSITGKEYQDRPAQLEKLTYIHSLEFLEAGQAYWASYKRSAPLEPKEPLDFDDPETKASFKLFEAFLARKDERRSVKGQERLDKKREAAKLIYAEAGIEFKE